jgi:hypothetical protein
MDMNLIVALIGGPALVAGIVWFVVYSRRRHQKDVLQTSIKSQEDRAEKRAG